MCARGTATAARGDVRRTAPRRRSMKPPRAGVTPPCPCQRRRRRRETARSQERALGRHGVRPPGACAPQCCNLAFDQDSVDPWLAISPHSPVCNVWAVPVPPQSPASRADLQRHGDKLDGRQRARGRAAARTGRAAAVAEKARTRERISKQAKRERRIQLPLTP